MWWLIAWAALSLVTWAGLTFMLVAVPSSERASNADVLKVGAAWAIALLVVFGLVAAVQGIF